MRFIHFPSRYSINLFGRICFSSRQDKFNRFWFIPIDISLEKVNRQLNESSLHLPSGPIPIKTELKENLIKV